MAWTGYYTVNVFHCKGVIYNIPFLLLFASIYFHMSKNFVTLLQWQSCQVIWSCRSNCFPPNSGIHRCKYVYKLKVSMPEGSIKTHCQFQHLFSDYMQFYSNKLALKYFLFPPFFHLTTCGVVHLSDLQRWGDNGEGQGEKKIDEYSE